MAGVISAKMIEKALDPARDLGCSDRVIDPALAAARSETEMIDGGFHHQ